LTFAAQNYSKLFIPFNISAFHLN